MGQVRATQDGHAADGSNRVGSGGYNQSGGAGGGVSGDQIIYGNVTRGLGFTGPIHETDSKAFFGPTSGGISDRFVRNSNGAAAPYQPSFSATDAQPFYGLSRGVAPPSGTERVGYTGGYLGTSVTPQTPLALSSELTTGTDVAAAQLGKNALIGGQGRDLQDALGQTYLNGPLEAQVGANVFTGSPLYGIRSSLANGIADENAQGLYGVAASSGTAADRARFQSSDVRRMRNEVRQQTVDPNQTDSQSDPDANQPQGSLPSSNLNRPLESSQNNGVTSPLNRPLNSPNLANGANTPQGVQSRSTLIPARPQNDQFNLLKQRLERYQNPQMTAILNSQKNQRDLQAARAKAAGNSPTSRPSTGGLLTPAPSLTPSPAAPAFEPVAVTSLATGVRAKGLHDLLQSAEDLMRQGKFQSAIDKYNTAEQVDPNNSLAALGRANAELGAGYYHQASVDLHQVFESEPALLMGQYNLKDWMDAQRIQFVEKELNDLAAGDAKQEMPVFLLAYLAYNTGDPVAARGYLQEARKRAGDSDPLLSQVEGRWTAGNTTGQFRPGDLNK